MANVDRKPEFKKPQLEIASYDHSPTKGLIVVSVGKLTLGKFLFAFSTYNTPEKEQALLQRIGDMFEETINGRKPLVENLNPQEI